MHPKDAETSKDAADEALVRIDLHVHSRYSSRPYSWFLRSAHSAECYTEPASVYATAKARGMNLVTLCDHDTIDGALELRTVAEDTFISEEVSARFPEDGCIVHTIVIDISESQHREIQALRSNIYDLVSYLHHQGVEFFLCHPLSQVNRRLQTSHLERCLLMFRNLEIRNGTRDASHERCLRQILDTLTPAQLAGFAERHPQTPVFNADGQYGLVGGSDDHAGLSIARAFTTFAGELSGRGVTAALRARRTRPDGLHGTTAVLGHNVYGVLGGYLKHSGQLGGDQPAEAGPSPLEATLAKYAGHLAAAQEQEAEEDEPLDLTGLTAHGQTEATQKALSRVVETVLVRSGREAWGDLLRALVEVKPAELADSVPAVIKSMMLALPPMLGARWLSADIQSGRRYTGELLGVREAAPAAPRVAVLTDTIDDVNGVAIGLRRLRSAAVAAGHDLRLVCFGDGDHVTVDADGVVRLPAVLRHRLAEYASMEFGLPHLPSLLNYLVDNQIDLIQCSTPGPVGLVGLLAARMAGIPLVGQYHTDLPEYATRLTGDPVAGAILGKLVAWFYGAMDRVFVPSQAVAARLDEMGVDAEKIRRIPRGIDLELFAARRRDEHAFEALGLDGALKVLYVGRLSREKNLDVLLDGFARATASLPQARLVMIGDGPHASALAARAEQVAPGRVSFLGTRTGAELARLAASCDLFVSPSETETFGNTVVEAQASGLPVVVATRGAARENMIDGVTGLAVDARNVEEVAAAIERLLADDTRRRHMSDAAVAFAQRYDMRRAAEGTLREYHRFLTEHAAARAQARQPAAATASNGAAVASVAAVTAAGRVA
jgi:glycosyltransferase involved in cell wall biosynthesis